MKSNEVRVLLCCNSFYQEGDDKLGIKSIPSLAIDDFLLNDAPLSFHNRVYEQFQELWFPHMIHKNEEQMDCFYKTLSDSLLGESFSSFLHGISVPSLDGANEIHEHSWHYLPEHNRENKAIYYVAYVLSGIIYHIRDICDLLWDYHSDVFSTIAPYILSISNMPFIYGEVK